MQEYNWVGVLIAIAMLVITGFAGHFWWTYRKLVGKAENAASKAYVDNAIRETQESQRRDVEQVRHDTQKEVASIHRDISAVKEDTRSMADSVLSSIKGLEDRFDSLMLHLLNNGKK